LNLRQIIISVLQTTGDHTATQTTEDAKTSSTKKRHKKWEIKRHQITVKQEKTPKMLLVAVLEHWRWNKIAWEQKQLHKFITE